VRIIKGVVEAIPLMKKLFSRKENSGFKWNSLYELQDLSARK